PPDLVEACRRHDLPLLEVPEEVSFAAIAAAIAERVRAERALATDLLRALAEPADPGSLRAAVLACELPAAAAYVVLVAPGPAEALADLVQPLAAGAAVGELSAELAAAVVPRATGSPAGEQPAEWATALAAAVTTRARAGNARIAAGVGGPVPAASALPGALAEARYAQRAAQARTARPVVVSGAELASHVALLAAVPAPALAAFRGRLLDPLVEYDRTHQAGLVHTLTEFLDCNGSWSRCAEHLHVHVNTLRYRLSRVELLTGRDLDRFADRVDFFLALRSAPS
ncbi:MAG TPA: helix-turn-helix domain-containing protein, partial [Micromonosporaceae bacterium]|nr:helix-turn-helix domain-containing protein [Micromonosporaceae bacterium]